MTSRIKGAWILAGLTAFGSMVVGGREARATSVAQIKVNGGYNPVGDPFYNYVFNVYLEPGASLLPPTGGPPLQDSFTISSLPGIDPSSSYRFAPAAPYTDAYDFGWSNPAVTPYTISNPPVNTPSYGGDVTWAYLGRDEIDNTTDSPIYLGQFSILTTYDYMSNTLPLPPNTQIGYSYDIGGQTESGNGNFVLNLSVPEPASVILLLAGSVAIPLFVRGERRRRQPRSA